MRKSNGATDAQRRKNRRQSRGPEDIRRDLDLRNTARLRASQQSQNISVNHQQPPPNTSTFSSSSSSSSSSSVLHTNDNSNDTNEEVQSETSSPVKQRSRYTNEVILRYKFNKNKYKLVNIYII
jgi:hypothetical protein